MDRTAPGLYKKIFQPDETLYVQYIPEGVTDGSARPLIMVLHWGGMISRYHGLGILTGLALPALGDLGAIMVAPDCAAGDWTSPKCGMIAMKILEQVILDLPVDERKVMLMGYSIGGIGTWHIGSLHMDRFCCIMPISAPVPDLAIKTDWRIPIYVIHSDGDELFPGQQIADACERLISKGANLKLDMIGDATHFNTEDFIPAIRRAAIQVNRFWISEDQPPRQLNQQSSKYGANEDDIQPDYRYNDE